MDKAGIAALAETAARAGELCEATNNLELSGWLADVAPGWHGQANRLVDSLQFQLGKLAGIVTDDGWQSELGESLWAGTANRAQCFEAAALIKESN